MGALTLFGSLEELCGLTHGECASYLNVRPDTVKSWSSGRRTAPPSAEAQLIALWSRIEDTASVTVEAVASQIAEHASLGPPSGFEIGIPQSQAEAIELGWPSVGCCHRVAALVASRVGVPLTLVERGSTVATWLAIQARE